MPSWELFARAVLEALKDAKIDFSKIQALHLGNVYSSFTEKETNIAPLTLSTIGENVHIPSIRYESACASGDVAFRQGYSSILSGLYDLVLVGGTERLRAVPGAEVQWVLQGMCDERH